VEKDLREMKVKRWRQKAVGREEWASVVKEAKAVEGRSAESWVREDFLNWHQDNKNDEISSANIRSYDSRYTENCTWSYGD
jgi:predicted transposase YbfD/YdcC